MISHGIHKPIMHIHIHTLLHIHTYIGCLDSQDLRIHIRELVLHSFLHGLFEALLAHVRSLLAPVHEWSVSCPGNIWIFYFYQMNMKCTYIHTYIFKKDFSLINFLHMVGYDLSNPSGHRKLIESTDTTSKTVNSYIIYGILTYIHTLPPAIIHTCRIKLT